MDSCAAQKSGGSEGEREKKHKPTKNSGFNTEKRMKSMIAILKIISVIVFVKWNWFI